MQKLAETRYPIHELLRERWSPRAFADRMVEPEKLRSLLEAARWAPSSFNEQPWSFIVAIKEHPGEYERLLSCLVEGNVRWAQHAPVLMLSVAKLVFERNQKPNRHAFHDVGLAVENLVIQGMVLGLFVHQMAGFHADRAREVYGIPEGYDPVAAMAIGYLDDPGRLPDDLREREVAPRIRKPLESFVFSGQWGQPSRLVHGKDQ
ncbi:MAG: nitroreductase family protein [Candidatus Methylomirabilales bacterium]